MKFAGIIVVLAAILCYVCITPLRAHAEHQPRNRIQSIVDDAVRPIMAKDKIAGMAIGIIVAANSSVFNYGLASIQSRQAVTDQTLFEIGSISKTFTATLTSWAALEHRLSLSGKVENFLPSLRNTPFGNVTLLNLGTHTPGRVPLQVPEDIHDEDQFMAYLKAWHPTYPPGTYRTYSNLSIGTLGVITAKSMGQDFTVLMEQRLLPALGMKNTFINIPATRMSDYAQGYTKEGQPIRMTPGVLWSEAYGIKSTASDLIRFVEANMNQINLDSRLQVRSPTLIPATSRQV